MAAWPVSPNAVTTPAARIALSPAILVHWIIELSCRSPVSAGVAGPCTGGSLPACFVGSAFDGRRRSTCFVAAQLTKQTAPLAQRVTLVLVGMHGGPRPDQARVAEHHREQPDDANGRGLVGERKREPGEVDLRLLEAASATPGRKCRTRGRGTPAGAMTLIRCRPRAFP